MSVWFAIGWTAVSLLMVAAGGIWWLAPARFVRIYRRILRADRFARTARWEQQTRSVSGRFVGLVLVSLGCVFLWLLYSPLF